MIGPRDYQLTALGALEAARRSGKPRALMVMATGLGKTVTAAWEIQKILADEPKARVLVLCHQNEILDQNERRFREVLGESVSMSQGFGLKRNGKQITFASFQSLTNQLTKHDPEAYDYVVVDEVHHIEAETFNKVFNHFKPKFAWGMTATKERGDGQSIEKTLGAPVFNLELPQAMARGLLTKVNYFVLADDMVRVGEITVDNYKVTKAELNRRIFISLRDEEIVRRVQDAWETIEAPRTVVYARGIEHAENLAKLLGGKVFYAGMREDREEVLKAFKSGTLATIVAVNLFNEGIDVPEANCIVFARSTQSRTIFYQQLGRGLRPLDDKANVTVLDFVADIDRLETLQDVAREVEDEARRIGSPVRLGQGSAGSGSDGDGGLTIGVDLVPAPGYRSLALPATSGELGLPLVAGDPAEEDLSPPTPTPVRYLKAEGITFNFDINSVALGDYVARRSRLYTTEGILEAAVSIIQERGLGRALRFKEVDALSKQGCLPSYQTIVDQFADVGEKNGGENFRKKQYERLDLPVPRQDVPRTREAILDATMLIIEEQGLDRALFYGELRQLCKEGRLPSYGFILNAFADTDEGRKNSAEKFRRAQYERLDLPVPGQDVPRTREAILNATMLIIEEQGLERALSHSELRQLSKQRLLPSRDFIVERFADDNGKNGWVNFQKAQYERLGLMSRHDSPGTREEILEAAVEIANERRLRRALIRSEIRSLSKQRRLPSVVTIIDRFADDDGKNGWSNFRQAQYDRLDLPVPRRDLPQTREDILDAVMVIIQEQGLWRALGIPEIDSLSKERRLPSYGTIVARFADPGQKNGGEKFREAQYERLQVPAPRESVPRTTEAILDAAVAFIDQQQLRRALSQSEVVRLCKQGRLPSYKTIADQFADDDGKNGGENFRQAQYDRLGLPAPQRRANVPTSKDAIVDAVVSLIKQGGLRGAPSQLEVHRLSKEGRVTGTDAIIRRFADADGKNGWSNFTQAVNDALTSTQVSMTSAEASVPPSPAQSRDGHQQARSSTPNSDAGSLVL